MTPLALALPVLVSPSPRSAAGDSGPCSPPAPVPRATSAVSRPAPGAARFDPCGNCPDGARVAAELERCGWRRPVDTLTPEVLPRPQRLARLRWSRSFPAYATPAELRTDPVRVAAMETPDDRGADPDLSGLA